MVEVVWEEESDYQTAVVDQDGLWKKVIQDLFEDFLLFFLPELHREVDFSKNPVFLQQELYEKIIKDKSVLRSTDQLIQVRLKDGKERFILVHVEVQGTNEEGFAKRMFQYFYRIFDQYEKQVVTVAIMTSPHNTKFPTTFHYNFFGTELFFAYNNRKLIDYSYQELQQSDRLFSKIVLAAKYRTATKDNPDERYTVKEQLMESLIHSERYTNLEIQAAVYFIDYLLRLPDKLTKKLNNKLMESIGKERLDMVHQNSGEWSPTMEVLFANLREDARKIGIVEGREEGIEQGIVQGVEIVAIEMLKKNMSVDLIVELTKIEREEVERLRDGLPPSAN